MQKEEKTSLQLPLNINDDEFWEELLPHCPEGRVVSVNESRNKIQELPTFIHQ